MRKFAIMMIVVLLSLHAQPQDKSSEPTKTAKRFFVGLSYSYMNIDVKLSGVSLHSVWDGQDLGTQDLTWDEVDTINSYVNRVDQVNNLYAEFGMKILDKPGSKWKVEGSVMLGLAKFYSKVNNTTTGTNEYIGRTDFLKPSFGIGFNVGFKFNKHWGVSVKPMFATTMGKISNVEDNINLVPVNVTQTNEDKFYSIYERCSLNADFTAGPVTISAGPGFYWVSARHKYTITRTNNLNGKIYSDEINTWTMPRYCFDGNVKVTWRVIEPLTFYAMAGFGWDMIVNTGLHFNF